MPTRLIVAIKIVLALFLLILVKVAGTIVFVNYEPTIEKE
jgi:hypothetical protein